MNAITYSDLRANLACTMDRVCEDHAPVIVTRQKSKPVVMMSLEDYHGIEETFYLLSSSANAKRLREAIANIKAGNVIYVDKLLD